MERKKTKVLHMLTTDRYSGAENVVCQIAHMFKELDQYEVLYCSPDGPIREALADRDVTFVPMKAASLSEFRRAIGEVKPDIVHAHDMRASFLASFICGKASLISHIHNNSFASRKLTLKALLYCCAVAKANHIFWVSDSAYQSFYFRRLSDSKSSVLHNIIDPDRICEKAIQAENNTAYDVVFVGRMSYPKNPQRLVTVLEQVVRTRKNTTAAIIGSGEMDEEIQALIKAKGLDSNVHFIGFMNNPYGIIQNAKVMIMTSRWEGTPMCALEAMALGVPIVSTPTDGLSEIIEHGSNGYLSDEDEQLAEHIVELLDNHQLHKRMSMEQRQRSAILNDVSSYRERLLNQYKI